MNGCRSIEVNDKGERDEAGGGGNHMERIELIGKRKTEQNNGCRDTTGDSIPLSDTLAFKLFMYMCYGNDT